MNRAHSEAGGLQDGTSGDEIWEEVFAKGGSGAASSWLSEAARLHQSGAPMQEVLACLETALSIDPLHADALYSRGAALGQLGAAPEEQLACYEAALAVNPLHTDAHVNRRFAVNRQISLTRSASNARPQRARVDPSDGGAYTEAEFERRYGVGCQQWDMAAKEAIRWGRAAEARRAWAQQADARGQGQARHPDQKPAEDWPGWRFPPQGRVHAAIDPGLKAQCALTSPATQPGTACSVVPEAQEGQAAHGWSAPPVCCSAALVRASGSVGWIRFAWPALATAVPGPAAPLLKGLLKGPELPRGRRGSVGYLSTEAARSCLSEHEVWVVGNSVIRMLVYA